MDSKTIARISEKIKEVKIAVYGDFCLDAYWVMDPKGSEVSVETGIKAKSVAQQRYSLGGAGNVVANIAALKPKAIHVIGVIGDDIHGHEMIRQFNKLDCITTSLTVQKEEFATYTYLKRILNEKEQARIDFGLHNARSMATDQEILKNIRFALENYDVLVFNQQVKGSITNASFIDDVNKLFETFSDKIIIMDARDYNSQIKNVYRKINEIEAGAYLGKDYKPRSFVKFSDINKDGAEIYKDSQKPVFVSCGSRGIISFDKNGTYEVPGIQVLGKIDIVGAGDTTVSALALCLAAGVKPQEAAEFANFAAAVTIQKLFTTGTASAQEIIDLSKIADFNHHPDLAEDIRQLEYYKDTEFELCHSSVEEKLGDIRHAIFDHDGTISILREGWEHIMIPVMMEAILGNQYDSAKKSLYDTIMERVLNFIDTSTGIQTILQMEGLVNLVDEFNIVPKNEILDKFAYKEIYNDALMEMVNKRIIKLEKGELSANDYIMKGAVEFINGLKKRGIKLYMASGTDKQDVINEAEVLGYAHLFDGGIYGSVGDVSKYSKKMV
ncbi:MAG: hypothetical protein KAH25_11295, partial [Bacteroidales bacterium]|nr:hypothetical protein [Bacteroidales bacterium]